MRRGERRDLEQCLGSEQLKEARFEWLKDDLLPWFPYQRDYQSCIHFALGCRLRARDLHQEKTVSQLLCAAVVSPAIESIAKAVAGLVILLFLVGVPCLIGVFLVGLASGRRGGQQTYKRRATLLSENERSFYHSLQEAVAGRYAVYAQVRLADLLQVRIELRPPLRRAALMRVAAKHADFVLCEPKSLSLVGVIELDDRSHRRRNRQRRDEFFDEALASAGLPLLRLAAKSTQVG